MSEQFILEMRSISKSFPGVKALDGINFKLKKGEVHALVGENGAGKSTLMKILSCVYKPDEGEIFVDGERKNFNNTRDAENAGIRIIHQELNLCDNLTVADNIFVGRENSKFFCLEQQKINQKAKKILEDIGINDLDVNALVGDLSVARKQIVEIAKAVSFNCKILIMDEPTSALADHETELLFNLIRGLKDKGTSIVYISHKFEEIYCICENATVIRDGTYVGTVSLKKVTRDELVAMMVGRQMLDMYPGKNMEDTYSGETILEVRNLENEFVKEISFSLRKGEILGISGLVGSGRTELAKTIFGKYVADKGEILLENKKLKITSPRDAIENGIMLVTEDRKREGLVLILSINKNISSSNMDKVKRFFGLVDEKKEVDLCNTGIKRLNIKTPGPHQLAKNLSGGNQQKVILAKWLASKPKVLILDEPTRGIDVGAKHEIYTIMRELQKNGISIIMISSELPEILGMSDRVAVMRKGRIVALLDSAEAKQENIMHYSVGGYFNEQTCKFEYKK